MAADRVGAGPDQPSYRLRPMILRRARAALLVIGAAALLWGCGDSADAPPSAKDGDAPSGKPIKIMTISEILIPDSGIGYPEIPAAAEARVKHINSHGGIGGRPVELISCNTRHDPNGASACARKAVAENVVAVVGAVTNHEAQVFPILEKARIPAIGTTPITTVAGSSPIAFCSNPGVAGAFIASPQLLAKLGSKRVTLIYPGNIPIASAGVKAAYELGAKAAGVELTPLVTYSFGQSQFDAEVAKAIASGVDGLTAFAPGAADQAAILRAVKQQAPDLRVDTVVLGPEVMDALGSGAEGIYSVGITEPATWDAPGTRLFHADMDAYAKDLPRTGHALNTWAAVWTFERVAKTLGAIDRASVLKGMRGLRDLDMGGIYPPLSTGAPFEDFPGMTSLYNPTVVYQEVKNGELTAVDGEFVNPFPPSDDRG
jgi:ABC-type branched-subunit amino acid transport system substrate-binding protein